MWGLAQALHCRDLTLKLSHRLLWAPGKAGPLLGGGGGHLQPPCEGAEQTRLALQLGLLGGPRGSQAADHVLELLVALHQQADLMTDIQTAGWTGGLRVDLAGHRGACELVWGHAHGQQRGGRAQHVLDDGPELVQLGAGQTPSG